MLLKRILGGKIKHIHVRKNRFMLFLMNLKLVLNAISAKLAVVRSSVCPFIRQRDSKLGKGRVEDW